MSNKQSSVEWYRQEIMKILYNRSDNTLNEIDIFEQAKSMHNEEMQTQYQEGREIGKIEILASQSTKNASEYSQGYNKGFLAALEYMNSTIENKIKIRQ